MYISTFIFIYIYIHTHIESNTGKRGGAAKQILAGNSVLLCKQHEMRAGDEHKRFGVATIRRLLNIIGLFCKRAL